MTIPYSPDEPLAPLLQKLEHFCAYQERCALEVRQKLSEWKVPVAKAYVIIQHLKENGFLDDARFARIFAGGKFRHNKWGRVKIRYELKRRHIPEEIISKALDVISDEEYMKTIRELILKKRQEIKEGKNLNIREKIITFVIGKGFEFDPVAEVLKELKI